MENLQSSKDFYDAHSVGKSPTSKRSPRSLRPRTALSSSMRRKSSSTRATGKHSPTNSNTSFSSTASIGWIYSARRKTWAQSTLAIDALYKGGFITKQSFKSARSWLDGFESKKRTSITFTILLTISPSQTLNLELCGYTNGNGVYTIHITTSDLKGLKR